MNYKLVAIDLDGTLLDPYLKISRKNTDVIQNAINKGVNVTLSTGRMFSAALPFARQLKLDVPLITCNGASIICAQSKKVYYERTLPANLVLSVIAAARELGLQLSLYTIDDVFVEDPSHNEQIHRKIDNAQVKVANLEETAVEKKIIKILFTSDNLYDDAAKIYRLFQKGSTFYFSLPWFVEIVALGVDKGDALAQLAGKFAIEPSEIIAIGDNFNDLPMLEYAGLGVAMGNAPGDIKMLADYVTRSHDDDGVAHVLQKFVLHESYEREDQILTETKK